MDASGTLISYTVASALRGPDLQLLLGVKMVATLRLRGLTKWHNCWLYGTTVAPLRAENLVGITNSLSSIAWSTLTAVELEAARHYLSHTMNAVQETRENAIWGGLANDLTGVLAELNRRLANILDSRHFWLESCSRKCWRIPFTRIHIFVER